MERHPVTGIYPGSFDPVTNGHIDIIQRSLQMCDLVIPAILVNTDKTPLFTPEERLEMLSAAVLHLGPRVKPIYFSGLLVNAAQEHGASVIIRGIRAVSDYEYELQMALMNRTLAPTIETVFMVPAGRYSYLSSRLVKEVFACGGELKGLIPEPVAAALRKKHLEL
jgi:pantetheine-phosphate adenylyltransferase